MSHHHHLSHIPTGIILVALGHAIMVLCLYIGYCYGKATAAFPKNVTPTLPT